MARRLQHVGAELLLTAELFELHHDQEVGNPPRTPTDADVAWELAGAGRAGWEVGLARTVGPIDSVPGRALLPLSDGVYLTDSVFDVGANGPRTVRSPKLEASGVRAWLAIEILLEEPTIDAVIKLRLWDGVEDLYWDGADWSTASNPATHWNTSTEVAANFAAFPATNRALQVVAWLSTSDEDYTPTFYGARAIYGCREIGDQDDALNRTVLASLRAELRPQAVEQFATTATLTSHQVAEELAGYDVQEVLAAFNLTDDPNELVELPGVLASGVWTPTTPIAAGKVLRLEFSYLPNMVTSRHRSISTIDSLPRLLLAPAPGGQSMPDRREFLVRDLVADPPTALALERGRVASDLVAVVIQTELANDLQRLIRAFHQWFGPGDRRDFLSPATGRSVAFRLQGDLEITTGLLTSGVHEARGTARLTYTAAGEDTSRTVYLLEADGTGYTLED
jgi:hypothetical protein